MPYTTPTGTTPTKPAGIVRGTDASTTPTNAGRTKAKLKRVDFDADKPRLTLISQKTEGA